MTAPNMATITASLERSLQNCTLNNRSSRGGGSGSGGFGRSSSSDDVSSQINHLQQTTSDDTSLDLNSDISLPYQWEQCLDLKTGEIYYINWRNGMKAKEDPRTTPDYSGDYYYSSDESSYDGEESSSESSPCSSRDRLKNVDKDHVLVVAGCKICLMYFMVPKQVEDCPKCSGHLLHFDSSENGTL